MGFRTWGRIRPRQHAISAPPKHYLSQCCLCGWACHPLYASGRFLCDQWRRNRRRPRAGSMVRLCARTDAKSLPPRRTNCVCASGVKSMLNGGEGARHLGYFPYCNQIHDRESSQGKLGKTHHPAYATLCDPMRGVTFYLVGWMMGEFRCQRLPPKCLRLRCEASPTLRVREMSSSRSAA